MRLQTAALESSLPQTELPAPFTFGNDPTKTLDDQGL